MARCRTCKQRKWQVHLNNSQQLRAAMAEALLSTHGPSLVEKRRMQMKIAAEFCRLGKADIPETCTEYNRSWWRSLIMGD